MTAFVMLLVRLRDPYNFRLDFHCCPVGRKQNLLWTRFMAASCNLSISLGVDISQLMIVHFNVCGLIDFHEGNFSEDCNDKMLTLLSLM